MNKYIIALSVSILAAVSFAVASAADGLSEQAKAQLTAGEQLLNAGDVSRAQVELKKVIDNYPTTEWTWWARVRLSNSYLHQKRFDDCILEARKVVNLYPLQSPQLAAAWAQLNIGLAYNAKGDTESAIWEFERVATLLGNHPDRGPVLHAKRNLALAHHGRSDRKKSLKLAKEILNDSRATDDDRAWALAIIGAALVGDWKTKEGLAELKKVKDLFPQCEEQILMVERKIFDYKYLAQRDYDGAIKEGKSIAENPSVTEPRARQARHFVILASLYKEDYTGAIAEAQAFLDKYKTLSEEHVKILMLKARAHAMKKEFALAVKSLEAALEIGLADYETSANIEWDLATCYRAMGDRAGANARYLRLTELYPESHLAVRAGKELGR